MDSKLNFRKFFWWSVFIMFSYKIFQYLDIFPPICIYGDKIYHILYVILDIVNQLAIATAGAIIFYHLNLFLDTRKKFKIYNRFRSTLLDILYCNIDKFKCLNNKQIQISNFQQIRELNKLINNYHIEDKDDSICEEYLQYIPKINYNIRKYLLSIDNQKLVERIESANRKIKNVRDCSLELEFYNNQVNHLIDTYDSLKEFNDILKDSNQPRMDYDKCKNVICVVYIKFLQEVLNLFLKFDEFTNVLERCRIIKFIRISNKNMKGNILEDI